MSDTKTPFGKALEFLHKVKYGGAVGKLSAITIVALLMCGVAMVCGFREANVILPALGGVVLLVVLAFREIKTTLLKHPELALLDGTEIVALRKAQMATKDAAYIAASGPPVLGSGDAVKIEGPTE